MNIQNEKLLINDSINNIFDNQIFKFTVPIARQFTELSLTVSNIDRLTTLYYIIQKDLSENFVPDFERPYIESHVEFKDYKPVSKNILNINDSIKPLDLLLSVRFSLR